MISPEKIAEMLAAVTKGPVITAYTPNPAVLAEILSELLTLRTERDEAREERDVLKRETFKATADAAEYHRDRAVEMWNAEHTARLAAEARLARQGEALKEAEHVIAVLDREIGSWECSGPDEQDTTVSTLIAEERARFRSTLSPEDSHG